MCSHPAVTYAARIVNRKGEDGGHTHRSGRRGHGRQADDRIRRAGRRLAAPRGAFRDGDVSRKWRPRGWRRAGRKDRMMRVHAIQTGTVEIKENQRRGRGHGPVRLANTLLDGGWTGPLPVWCWVVEHPEGVIVVDTGTSAKVLVPGFLPKWNPYYRRNVRFSVRPEEEVGPRMRELGIPPEEVRWVVLTHLHVDHDGSLHHFPNAEVLVGRWEYDFATGLAGRATGYLPN